MPFPLLSGVRMKKRNLDLAAELGEDIDVTEEESIEANTRVAVAPEPVAPVPMAPIALTLEQIQALMASATAGSAANNAALAESITQGIAQARKPIPEGTDQSNPRISDANPLGDRDHPRPLLKCEFFLGTQNADGKVARTYPYEQGDLTVREILALNILQPGHFSIALHDGATIILSVVPEHDGATDALRRLVLVLPGVVTEKKSALKNMLPGPCGIVAQITGVDFSKLKGDALAWLMAEHRAGRYVASREEVAA